MEVLQAYIDDSAAETGDQRLFLAGYVHTAEAWASFSNVWALTLADVPAIDYLHMVEANNLRGQFKGWKETDRDQKLQKLSQAIQMFHPMSFEFSVSRREYNSHVKSFSPHGIGSAHFVSIFAVVSGLARHVHEIGINVPIDFIFDDQDGASDDMNLFFSHMKKNLPVGVQALINGDPIFRDDRHVLPLQAADMLAWHIRREHEFGSGPALSLAMADRLRNPKGHLSSRLQESDLKRWAKQFATMPAITLLQGKSQWKGLKKEIRRLIESGVDPAQLPKLSRQETARLIRERNSRGRKE